MPLLRFARTAGWWAQSAHTAEIAATSGITHRFTGEGPRRSDKEQFNVRFRIKPADATEMRFGRQACAFVSQC
jgi:hypothetical protein